jgi:hypothetical protein
MSTLTIVLIAIAILIVAFGVLYFVQKERTRRLRGTFGPEYDRALKDHGGSQYKAEHELLQRQKRHEKLHVRELMREEIARYSDAWREVQTYFVDAPRQAVAQADQLVRDVMSARGYPITDFEHRAEDISVDHPRVVENYRAAHRIAERDAAGQTDTEDLRQAMVHYRALFEDLLGIRTEFHTHEVTR